MRERTPSPASRGAVWIRTSSPFARQSLGLYERPGSRSSGDARSSTDAGKRPHLLDLRRPLAWELCSEQDGIDDRPPTQLPSDDESLLMPVGIRSRPARKPS